MTRSNLHYIRQASAAFVAAAAVHRRSGPPRLLLHVHLKTDTQTGRSEKKRSRGAFEKRERSRVMTKGPILDNITTYVASTIAIIIIPNRF